MHFCGIIVKEKNVSVVEARELLGEELVNKGIADWFSVDDYRERTFGEKQVVSLGEFLPIIEEWLNSIQEIEEEEKYFSNEGWVFSVVEQDFIKELIIPNDFYEFYSFEQERKELINLYTSIYKKEVRKILNNIDQNQYNVCLLDYHN
jgi:hypothetical protein